MDSKRIIRFWINFIPIIILVLCIYLLATNQPNILLALTSLLAIIVALFKEDILQYIKSPELKLTISSSPEHLHETNAIVRDEYVERRIAMDWIEKQKWLGVVIENIGLGKARNVEIYFSGIKSNIIQNFASYKNIPLKTSWTNKSIIKLLPPNIGIRLDLCYIAKNCKELNFCFSSTPIILEQIECKPNKKIIFNFKIIAVADNAKSKVINIEVTYFGDYKKGIKVKLI